MTTIIRNISRLTSNHFLFTRSIITPANKASAKPGAVAEAIILPSVYSEPVFSRTIQLIAMRLNPKPINDITFPKKNNKNVLFELEKYTKKLSKKIFSYKSYSCFYGSEMGVIEKLHNLEGKENICLVVNPIFLFTGFLYKSVKKKFENLKFKNTFFTEPLMKEPEILNILSHRVTKVINSL